MASTALRGTTQNDVLKEYLSRGTYIFPPVPSRRLIVDMIAWCAEHAPAWNPMNVCSYHLQEAGATPVQEIAFALANAVGVLDAVRDSGQVAPERFPQVVGAISFFVNAGIRFVEEVCKLRAFTEMWDRICRERYGVEDPKLRRFRYGVQVNSLGLTEAQPENNIQRIVLEMLAVTLSKRARARSVQLPAWNEALGLPRPWDQQWSLRMQQVLAYETDLLEYADLFDGSHVVEARTAELAEAADAELQEVLALGGAFEAVDELKGRLVRSMAERTRRIEAGEQVVIGVNRFTETEPSPLGGADAILRVDPAVEQQMVDDVQRWRADRDAAAVAHAAGRAPASRRGQHQPHAADHRAGPRRRHDRRVGRRPAGGVRRVPGTHRRGRRGGSPHDGARRRGRAGQGDGRRAAAAAGREARAGRPLQRRRADRGRGSGRRHGGGATRGSGSPRSRSPPRPGTRTPTSSACRSSPAATWSWCP